MATKKFEDFNAYDRIEVKLLESSVHFLNGDIDGDNIGECIRWIVYENLTYKADKFLTLYINSQGGDLYQAFALIDIMSSSKLPIRTIGIGNVMSSGFLIFASGTQGERYIAPNAGIMCHQFSSIEDVGKYHDIRAQRKETDRLNQTMVNVLKNATGLDIKTIKSKLLPPHDVYMTAYEMISLNAADHILEEYE